MNWKTSVIAPIIAGLLAAGMSALIYGSTANKDVVGFNYSFWLLGEFFSGFAITLGANFFTELILGDKDEKA